MSQYIIHPNENKNIKIEKFAEPFPHIIIDNLFEQKDYQTMCEIFPSFISRVKPYKDTPGATSNYEGYISGLSKEDVFGNPFDFFASRELKNFVEKEFGIETTKYVAPSAHFHKAPSKDGFIHRDMNICSFKETETEDFVFTNGTIYTNDSRRINCEKEVKVIRSVALLYYLNNDNSESASGGGTGIYNSYNGEVRIKEVEPKNNRLFLFEINNMSYHAFIGANFNRSAVVTWFHSKPALFFRNFIKKYNQIPALEKWSNVEGEPWSIEYDPEFSIHFPELKEHAK